MDPRPRRHRHARGRGAGDFDVGALVRAARQAQGLTLAGLGRKAGYSASQISRLERGQAPLTVVTLRRFAAALAIPPQALGLLPVTGDSPRHAMPIPPSAAARSSTVVGERREDGEDPVRRRELLVSAGLAATGTLGLPARPSHSAARPVDAAAGLESLLYGRPATADPLPLPALSKAVTRARQMFQDARYDRLAEQLPDLIAAAMVTRDHAEGDAHLAAEAALANVYIVASAFMVKLNDDQLAWASADRAAQAAESSGDVLALADARRGVATVMRRTGRTDRARELLIATADEIVPRRDAAPEQLSMYGALLQTAAYTAAVDGDRAEAHDLIDAARAAATRLGRDTNHRHLAFGPTNVTLFEVSISQVLGDNGAAIAHAQTLPPASIPTRERQGRYWIDVARAWHQWGKPEACYRALLAAERAAPAEVRYRPPVHRMTADLLRIDRRGSLRGLRAFATRIGIPA